MARFGTMKRGAAAAASSAICAMAGLAASPAGAVPPPLPPYVPSGIAMTALSNGSVEPVSVPGIAAATAFTPVTGLGAVDTSVTADGSRALVADNSSTVHVVSGPWTSATGSSTVSLGQFTGEGGSGFHVYTEAAAVTPDGGAALVSADSQGLIQLVRSGSSYAVDTRFTAPGLNQAGKPHQPGWVLAPTLTPKANLYNGVAMSDLGSPTSGYTALTIDPSDETIGVITGVGTAGVHFAGTIRSAQIGAYSGGYGTSGMSFSPLTNSLATIGTSMGVGVLDLSNPASPTIVANTSLPSPAISTAVARDGRHVLAASGSKLYFFWGLMHARAGVQLNATAPPMSFPGSISALKVETNGDAVVQYVNAGSTQLAFVTGVTTATPTVAATVTISATTPKDNALSLWPSQTGYDLVASDGGSFSFGDAAFHGSAGNLTLNKPIVGTTVTPDRGGYWQVASDGGIFAYGDARFFGSTGSLALVSPIVGMAPTPDGLGYWLVAADGGIFAFGDATFHGSAAGTLSLGEQVVGMAATLDGKGYWLATSDGKVFPKGDATAYGSPFGSTLHAPIVGIASSPDGKGYLLVAADGGVFAYGDGVFYGSTGATTLNKPIVGMAETPDGGGYWLVASDGGIFSFGDAQFHGSTGAISLNKPIVGIAVA